MKRTALFERQKELGARMVSFSGWEMPVYYSGVLKEHKAVRERAGLFDISHMGEIFVSGTQAFDFLQVLLSNDLGKIRKGRCQYSLLLNASGAVVDDVIIYWIENDLFLICVNAGNLEKDLQWIKTQAQGFDVKIEDQSAAYGQLALQGPNSAQILKSIFGQSVANLKPFEFLSNDGFLISRTGYTGEDGFEIYVPVDRLLNLWDWILSIGAEEGLLPCGLGARDLLRLEMGYPLYGHELREDLTALEAGLSWVVAFGKARFIGKEALLKQKETGVLKKRVGLLSLDPGILREDYPIFFNGKKVGWITSGGYSPCLDKSIACGYVPVDLSANGSILSVEIREKLKKAEVVSLPFYHRK